MPRRTGVLAAVLLLPAAAAPGEPGKVSKEKISFMGKRRIYFLLVPAGIAPEKKLPLVVTLHGSGQDPEPYVSAWKDLAEKETIVIVGPASKDSVHWARPRTARSSCTTSSSRSRRSIRSTGGAFTSSGIPPEQFVHPIRGG